MPAPMFSCMDLSGMDLSGVDLSNESAAHSNIEGTIFGKCTNTNFVCCKGAGNFENVDVTGCLLERSATETIRSLVGALWRGQRINKVSDWITQDDNDVGYWCFCTDQFVQCGCLQRTLAEWEVIGENEQTIETLKQVDERIDTKLTLKWWRTNVEKIRATVAQLTQQA